MLVLFKDCKKQTPEEMGRSLLGQMSGETYDLQRVLELIQAGAILDRKCASGYTPLIYAALNDHTDGMRALIDAGAKIDEQSNSGLSALMEAAQCGRIQCVEMLIAAGADIDMKDNKGKTAQDYAGAKVAQILKEASAKAAEEKRKAADEKKRKYMNDTDFSKGLAHQIPAAKPLRAKPPGV
jgi:ankyrin repeat protein